jgi:hypothetical protein
LSLSDYKKQQGRGEDFIFTTPLLLLRKLAQDFLSVARLSLFRKYLFLPEVSGLIRHARLD